MELSEIRKLVAQDMAIDETELDVASISIPQLHNKYLNIYLDEKLVLQKLTSDYNIMKRIKWEYYTGKLDKEQLEEYGWEPFRLKILKQDIDLYMESDEELQNISNRKVYQKEKINYLDAILKSINNRQWNIRNAIEWKKFINGQ
ncbi:MAG: recombination mediator protein UvsY [Proteobacteria bacterium]|nr:recombination mediator protein UvsY [Pseudomonadota bacterium]